MAVISRTILINSYQDDGQWTAECWSLPGVVGCGDTEAGAVDSCWAALASVILTYQEQGRPVPWTAEAQTGTGTIND